MRQRVRFLGCDWVSICEADLAEETLLVDQELLLQALEAIAINACEAYDRRTGEKKVTCEVGRTGDPAPSLPDQDLRPGGRH